MINEEKCEIIKGAIYSDKIRNTVWNGFSIHFGSGGLQSNHKLMQKDVFGDLIIHVDPQILY